MSLKLIENLENALLDDFCLYLLQVLNQEGLCNKLKFMLRNLNLCALGLLSSASALKMVSTQEPNEAILA